MPLDRTMSVSLSDASRQTIVTFRRSGAQLFVDTGDGDARREHPVTAAELDQLASFLADLATTRWADASAPEPVVAPAAAPVVAPAPAYAAPVESVPPVPAPPMPRAASLPPYPQSARWVPAPSGVETRYEGTRD